MDTAKTPVLELIGKYIDTDAVIDVLGRKEYDRAAEMFRDAVQKICVEHPSDEERIPTLNYLLIAMQYHVVYAAMEALCLDLSAGYDDTQAMCAEFERFLSDGTLGEAAWLYEITDDDTPVPCMTHKEHFFRMLRALSLTAADFDDYPAPHVAVPKVQFKSYGTETLATVSDAEIVDDGGLCADFQPLGKDFVLRDADGCVYHLHALRQSEVPGGLSLEGGRHYAADGWIDGYTDETSREIELEIMRGGKFVFSYFASEDDILDARWAEYTDWSEQKILSRRARLENLIRRYTEKS